jgi:anti-anti-sigma factor
VDEQGNTPLLTVGSVTQDDVVVVVVAGEVDMDTAGLMRAELTARLDLSPPALVVDLDGVAFFGSAGIALLLEAKQRTDDLGARLVVVAGRRALRPLAVTGVVKLLDLAETRADAIRMLNQRELPALRSARDH